MVSRAASRQLQQRHVAASAPPGETELEATPPLDGMETKRPTHRSHFSNAGLETLHGYANEVLTYLAPPMAMAHHRRHAVCE
jgi:hypothetical protein